MAANSQEPSFSIRTHRPGDLGYIVSRHGALYSQEYNYAPQFEALVARVAADFIDNFDSKRERCWIAEKNGAFLGSVVVAKDPARSDTAKLRLLLVEPEARGLGLGKTLVRMCVAFAAKAGYRRMWLWTQSDLLAARKLYKTEGFQRVCEEASSVPLFTPGARSENWELELCDRQ